MMKTREIGCCVLTAAVFFCAGCGSSPGTCPSDDDLIERFNRNSSEFRVLTVQPEDKKIHEKLGIDGVFHRSSDPDVYWFVVWHRDFIGPGGCMKGYAYSERDPGTVADSIDAVTRPGSPEEKELYRQIRGAWYLFYRSGN